MGIYVKFRGGVLFSIIMVQWKIAVFETITTIGGTILRVLSLVGRSPH